MSYALITDGGEDGRYTIYMDYGEARRTAILQQVALAQVKLAEKIVAQQAAVAVIDANEATSLANLQAVQDALIADMGVGDEGPGDAALQLYNELLKRHRALVIGNQPVRDALRTLETQQARAAQQYSYWSNLDLSTEKQAWCCDMTEDATGYVATVDIPGETNLTLIAPGGRSPILSDGTISQAKKDAALALLGGRLVQAEAAHADLVAKLATATAAETTLKATLASAQAAVVAARASGDPIAIQETQKAFDAATKALNDNRSLVAQLTLSVFNAVSRVAKINQDIATWNAKAASATPVYGDGAFYARELMSPEQAYFNAAILPGWQKYMPTYRWATIDRINDDGTVDLTFGSAVSSVQSLDVNDKDSLQSVPVTYMACDAAAFTTGDRCVVDFDSTYPSSPTVWTNDKCRVIGFLDNPKRCGNVRITALRVVQFLPGVASPFGTVEFFQFFGHILDADILNKINSSSITWRVRKNLGVWEACSLNSVASWSLQEPLPPTGTAIYITIQGVSGFVAPDEDPTANFAFSISTINGWSSPGTVVEYAGYDGTQLAVNFAATIESVAPGIVISETLNLRTFSGLTAYAHTRTQHAITSTSQNFVKKLENYSLEME